MDNMMHHDVVVSRTINMISDAVREQNTEAYVVQNIYGKLMVYLETQNRTLANILSEKLSAELGPWFQGCDILGANIFVKNEIDRRKRDTTPIRDHVWLFEKYLTNLYWDDSQGQHKTQSSGSKLVSFYSFKGGVGRTTSMLMAAIALARQGKKVILIDFDLEAPGIAGLFPQEYLPKYGLLDFLVECNVQREPGKDFFIDEYIYPIGEFCQATAMGGEIYAMPAYGSILKEHPDLYRKSLMRFDLNLPIYFNEKTPIDFLLAKLDDFVSPDLIFIDTRSGIHQIGGITLTRYSDLALLFFYGSQQNIDGMKMVLPHVKKFDIPFLLVNAKVPANEEVARIEENIYIEGAYEALCACDPDYRGESVAIDDETAEHFPVKISYNAVAEVLQNTEQLIKAFEEQASEYHHLADAILDALSLDMATAPEVPLSADLQDIIIQAFSSIMGDLETAAAEDEFSTADDLRNNFYPLQAFSFIFEPKKFLILGQKGVGKTALFSALKNKEYAVSLAKYLNAETKQYEQMEWLVGTSNATSGYNDIVPLLSEPESVRAFWYYTIIKVLIDFDASLYKLLPDPIADLMRGELNVAVIKTFRADMAFQLSELLKVIDKEYATNKKYVTIIYDALDCIVSVANRGSFLSELIDIWYKNMNVLTSIRSKIFLREDIFNREIDVADIVKLRNYSSVIKWQYDQLFAMVWKRAISRNDRIKEWYFKTVGYTSEPEHLSELGYIPATDAQKNKDILSALIGTKMGSGNKASTYNWFRNRLADTKGVIVPRSMIDIFSKAASAEQELRKKGAAVTKSIIRPKCFEDKLGIVSEKRVADLKEEFVEYREFFEKLKNTIQRSPVSEEQLKNALGQFGLENQTDEIHKLIDIGVIKKYQRRLSDPVRYHFPDIYLLGLGLQRSGMR